ncbi:Hypothetical protein CINCED_3A002345 [Cinara cedri]|uniref:Uncharacterized protein n=1 Tax=Cinara cedri TaxID=506608 RepID=A0A5E4N2A9_9HEMI|nr:Hypothetical protein CINCED_3A002345 [Cinara cedri]
MQGAGKRPTKVPDRYNPSASYRTPSILPTFDLSLNMSDNESSTARSISPPIEDCQPDLRSLLLQFHTDSKKQFKESQRQCQNSFLDLKKDMTVDLKKDMTEINTNLLSILESTSKRI